MTGSHAAAARTIASAGLLVLVLVTACGSAQNGEAGKGGTILVSAASSLTDVFGAIAAAYEAQHPGADVVLNFASSSTLREQILEGAPVDVFASADQANMNQIATSGTSRAFAANTLQIAVPPGNPAGITGLADFARPELVLGLCAPAAPCGDLARRALTAAGITPMVDTEEPNVRALLTKVAAGELDAGITYVTDVAADPTVEGIPIPDGENVATTYPMAVLEGAPNPLGAEAFVAFVLSEDGRAILAEYGFTSP